MPRKMLANIAEIARQTVLLLRSDAPLYLAIAVYTMVGLVLLESVGRPDMAAHRLYLDQWVTMFLLLMPAIALSFDAVYVVHRFDKRRTLAFRRVFSPGRISCLLSGGALMMGLMVFQGTFTSIKNVFPMFHHGFPYDRVHADIDAALHFGIDPWRILHAAGGTDFIRRAIEWNYNMFWFLLCFGGLFFVVTAPRARRIRKRYITMFMLVWVICGNILAGLFLSAGPAYYGAVTGDEVRFSGLLDFIGRSGDVFSSASRFQNYLWELYSSDRAGFGSGISAFPSVHVGMVAMNAFFLLDKSRPLGLVAIAYLGLIIASSVYLGWHYAIDGYVSVAVVAVLHIACKRLMPARSPAASSSAGLQPALTR